MDSTLAAKWLAVTILGLGSMSIGLIPPIFVFRFRRAGPLSSCCRAFLSCLLCFGAGVLFGTAIMHITQEARPILSAYNVGISVTEALLGAGFLFVYFVEEVVHFALHCCDQQTRHRQRCAPRLVRYSASGGDGPPCYGSVKICSQDEEYEEGRTEDATAEPSNHSASLPLLPNTDGPHLDYLPSHLSPTSSSLLLLALSLHSAIEGLTIGLESSTKTVIFMLTAVSIHKFVIAFCLGMEIVFSDMEQDEPPSFGKSAAFMGVFSLTSVLGVFAGVIVRYVGLGVETGETVCAMLQSVAAGALLHVALLEILPRERARCHRIGLVQFMCVTLGFGLSLFLEYSIT